MAVKNHFGGMNWTEWPEAIHSRTEEGLREYKEKLADEIDFQLFMQFKFFNKCLNVVNHFGQSVVRSFRISNLHNFHFVELVQAIKSAYIFAVRTGFATEASAVSAVLLWKAVARKNHIAVDVEYIDTEVQSLKLELKSLENKLQTLSEQKIEYLNDIEEFNTLYNLHLGELLKDILNLKKEILYKQTIKQQEKRKTYEDDIEVFNSTKENIEEIKQTIEEFEKVLEDIDEDNENYDEIFATYKELQEELGKLEKEIEEQEESLSKIKEELEVDEIFREYEEVKKQYEQFHQNYEDIKQQQSDVFDVTNEQKSELKKLWKKACKLCHPHHDE
jgi:tetratricopeptide (TPR) repeat protein